ncbi:MAG TPA: LD-carboxypeptidase [Anaerovoracaceae bacterium]|nr:LD-carboxypeptidase [Anaerovoracaceae bacterium]
MVPMIKPKHLKPGDRIALIAPSSPVDEDKLALAVDSIKFLGLKPILFPSVTLRHGYLSGSDEIRAQDVDTAFADSEIDGIFCIRGGYGVTRILNRVDFKMIAENPKVFLGYSDITGLHVALNQLCRLITFHGTMPSSGWRTRDPITMQSLPENLFCPVPAGPAPCIPNEPIEIINPGVAMGRIIGGNLSLLASTLGSPYEVDTKNKILFIEEVDERNYKVDRGLTALALAGKFSDCNGIILGTWDEVGDPDVEPDKNLTLRQIFEEVVKPFGKPTINNFRAGHIYPQITIPMGVTTLLDATTGIVSFLEAGTK